MAACQLLNVIRNSGEIRFELSECCVRHGPAELALKVAYAAISTKPAYRERDGKGADNGKN